MTALNEIHHVKKPTTKQSHNRNMHTDKATEGRPKEKACCTRPINMTALNEIHHVKKPPTKQSYNRKMQTNNPKKDLLKRKLAVQDQ